MVVMVVVCGGDGGCLWLSVMIVNFGLWLCIFVACLWLFVVGLWLCVVWLWLCVMGLWLCVACAVLLLDNTPLGGLWC